MNNFSEQIAALSPEQRMIFEKRRRQKRANKVRKQEIFKIEPFPRADILPLPFIVQSLWFFALLEPDSCVYNMSSGIHLQGKLNLEALQQSFKEIIARHETLRTNFITEDGEAVAIISEVEFSIIPLLDLSCLPAEEKQTQIQQQIETEAQQPFDISSDQLIRIKLLRLGVEEHIMLLTVHHIIYDDWSSTILFRELSTLYQAFSNGKPSPLAKLPVQYVDFAAWQRQWLQGEVLETQISYWLKQLENAPKILELPTDYPRPSFRSFRGSEYPFQLSQELSIALNELSQQQGTTLFMTLLAAFQTLLWRYTAQEDIVIGSPIANRNRAEIKGLIGFLVTLSALRTDLTGNPSFEELLKRVRETTLGAYAHKDIPFELLVKQLQSERDLSHTPLFQVMFIYAPPRMSALELSGLTLSRLKSENGTAEFDLTLYILESESKLEGYFEYNTDLFKPATIARMVGHLKTLLEAIVTSPQQRLSELALLTEPEQQQLLFEWNDTKVDYPQDRCIHQLFEAQVEKTPNAVAVVFGQEQLTYRQLNQRANQLAHYLQQLGVKPEVKVGICVERSVEMVIGLLAILKAGGAYIPLDPNYPQERLTYMLKDSQPGVLLTQHHLSESLPNHQVQVVCIDTDWQQITDKSTQNPATQITIDNLAYVIYTSGSTGKPKGVLGLHQGAVNHFYWMWENYPFTQGEVCCQKTSLNFVDSVWEIFGPLLRGISTVIIPDTVVKGPEQFVEILAANEITRLVLVPSLLRVLLDTCSDLQKRLSKLKLWVISGEALSLDLLQNFRQIIPESTLLNLYGCSEVSANVTCSRINPTQTPSRVTIGRPIANTQIYILDQYSQLVPVGVVGELCIGGQGLARGYFNRPDLSAEKFIPNPFSTEATRLYKTGDLARYLPSGDIEYIGRIDNQVKVRGFRIELGEIEAVVSKHPAVREAVVLVREDSVNCQQIVAYVVAQKEQTLTITELREFLESKLPNYMIPNALLSLEKLPLTPNGKIDRKALPIPDQVRPELEAVYLPPQTEVEKTIANIWQEVLRIEEVGIHDNFFELGGHSLLLVQVHNKLQKRFQQLSLVDIFQYRTINYLAKYLTKLQEKQQFVRENVRQNKTRTASMNRRKQSRQNYRTAKHKSN